jgi:RNA polymerase subunit RPABC4/transcription elongation factor Spt4
MNEIPATPVSPVVETPVNPPVSNLESLNPIQFVSWVILGLSLLLAVWMIYDSSHRYKNRWLFPLLVLAVGFGPFVVSYLLNPASPNYLLLASCILLWFLYLFIRPEYTRDEMRILESEQKIKDITRKYYEREVICNNPFCPVCGLPVKDDFLICPNCFKELHTACLKCGKLLDNSWILCPYCKSKQKRGSTDETKDI